MPDNEKEFDRGEGATRINGNDLTTEGVARDIFERASQLGGFFVVAFIAPVGRSAGPGGLNGQSTKQRALMTLVMDGLKEQEAALARPAAAAAPDRVSREKMSST